MMSMTPETAPEGWKEMMLLLDQIFDKKNDAKFQTMLFQKCHEFLTKNSSPKDWFCNSYLYPIASHLLVLFSFPPTQLATTVKEDLKCSILSCPDCLRMYYHAKMELKQKFTLQWKVSINNVKRFMTVIDSWELDILNPLYDEIQPKVDTLDPENNQVKAFTFACMYNPTLLKLSSKFNEILSTLLNHISVNELLPAMVHFLFEGSELQKKWTVATINRLVNVNGSYMPHNSTIIVIVEEFKTHLFNIQNSKFYTDAKSTLFWQNFALLEPLFDNDTILNLINNPQDLDAYSIHFDLRLYPLFRVLLNSIMAQLNEPLPIILRSFEKLLCRFKSQFWLHSQPFTFNNVLDNNLQNRHFISYIHELKPEAADYTQNTLSDVLLWIPALYDSLTGLQQNVAGVRLGTYLLSQDFKDANLANTILSFCLGSSLFNKCIKFDEEKPQFGSKNTAHKILQKRDARAAIDNKSELITKIASGSLASSKLNFESIMNPDRCSEINLDVAEELISNAFNYDIISLSHSAKALKKNEAVSSLDSFPMLWDYLLAQNAFMTSKLTLSIFRSFKYIAHTISFIDKKQENTQESTTEAKKQIQTQSIHNQNTKKIYSYINRFLMKLSLSDTKEINSIFQDKDLMTCYWSCVFTPEINQSAIDIIYQVFDDGDGGRFEAIKSLLGTYTYSICSVSEIVKILNDLNTFEPYPKATRILMDIVEALADPLKGLLVGSNEFSENKDYLVTFWKQSWRFLVCIYDGALKWASQYPLAMLIEFTRDTLDLSHKLLDSFDIFESCIKSDSEDFGPTLFQDFMDAFSFAIVWLRLGDTSLLNSCVELVFKGFDLAKGRDYQVDRIFLQQFVKYGAKAKKFNNKLTEAQRNSIISKAREFDEEVVDNVLFEVQEQRAKVKAPPAPSQPVINSIENTPSHYNYESHIKQPKQQTLLRFGVTTKEPPRPTPIPQTQFKSNSMEAIRQAILNDRNSATSAAPIKKPAATVAPAPPRPAGFNSKRATQVGRSLNTLKKKKNDNDSSSEEEAEEDVDLSDLFVEHKKKSKVTEIDIHGRPLVKPSINKHLSEKKKQEEYMRMRLNVNLKPLYTTVLKWNYNSDSDYPTKDTNIYQTTKDSYTDAKDYIKTMEPLLMLECWQGIQSAKQTSAEEPFELLIGSRTSCDGFFDVYASIKKDILQNRKTSDNDLLVLGHLNGTEFKDPKEISRYLKDPQTLTCLAKIREIKSANAEYADLTLRVYPQGTMMGLLTPKSVVVGMRVMQMTTVEREFSSLKGLQYYDLADEIFSGKPEKPASIDKAETSYIKDKLSLNDSQAQAIIGTYDQEGFSLIQGPPGTGKTKTILGIIGYYLAKSKKEGVIEVDKNSSTPEEGGPKVLVCAPSNAAVDELVLRLRSGVHNMHGSLMNPKVVRLGRSDAVNASVRDLALEELVEKQLQAKTPSLEIDNTLREKHTQCITERNKLRNDLQNPKLSSKEVTELEEQLREVNKKRNGIAKKLDEQREKISIASRTKDIEKRQLQAKILNGAQIICSTLSGSAHDFLASLSMKFDLVVVDEACQCVELSAIIPLRYGCRKCIMVGDPNQLPPTVLSQTAASLNYEQSLFVRMQKQYPESVYLLDVQYRMHPQISQFPSQEFYNSKLLDGEGMLEKNTRQWHSLYPLTPYMFFDVAGGKQQQNTLSKSLYNHSEAVVIMEMIEKLMELIPQGSFSGRIGIISPYKEQIRLLKDVFRKKYGMQILNEIDFNTVDGYQGQEKEIIIMSCVRASPSGSVGFLSDVRRMNVALTRAKTSLWIFGNKESLCRNKVWNHLIQNAEEHHEVQRAYPGFLNDVLKPIDASSMRYEHPKNPGSGQNSDKDRKRHSTKKPEVVKKGKASSSEENCSNSNSNSNSYYEPESNTKNSIKIKDSPLFEKKPLVDEKITSIGPKPNQTNQNKNSSKKMPYIYSSNANENLKTGQKTEDKKEPFKPTKSGVLPPRPPTKSGTLPPRPRLSGSPTTGTPSIFIKKRRPPPRP